MNKTIVFGGWAVSPDILKSIFGNDARYIDVNPIMPKLFASNQLSDNWIDTVISECQLQLTGGITIAGWSTGAMFAYAAARVCPPQNLILLSATPCFCRKDDFRFGTRPSVLDQMISALDNDRDAVLQSFYERSGLAYNPSIPPNYSSTELIHGLMFLKQANLRPITPLSINPIFYHGRDDLIIPISASKYFCEQAGGEHVGVDGGHGFFTKTTELRLC
jgi:pimeloyl-ACP methyl ester carboxylesterase